MEMLVKKCTKCNKEKPLDIAHFRANKQMKFGLDSWCRECAKEYRNKRRKVVPPKNWNIPESEIERFIDANEEFECVICGEPGQAIDHDHKTGRIRGKLCQNCNLGLGHFKDNPELLELAALYLKGECSCGECNVKWGGLILENE
jgi:hypothetical protein